MLAGGESHHPPLLESVSSPIAQRPYRPGSHGSGSSVHAGSLLHPRTIQTPSEASHWPKGLSVVTDIGDVLYHFFSPVPELLASWGY